MTEQYEPGEGPVTEDEAKAAVDPPNPTDDEPVEDALEEPTEPEEPATPEKGDDE